MAITAQELASVLADFDDNPDTDYVLVVFVNDDGHAGFGIRPMGDIKPSVPGQEVLLALHLQGGKGQVGEKAAKNATLVDGIIASFFEAKIRELISVNPEAFRRRCKRMWALPTQQLVLDMYPPA